MKCEICDREAKGKYCELHERAYKSVIEKYEAWKEAMEISWKEYLNEVAKNSYTGKWAKDVAEQLIKKEEEKQTFDK
ncbi:MAG: hypothetical protein U9O89_04845 [Thermoproteota archaeon]|nr:hypothetical protein [Thermoproteota archaeon]